MIKFKARCVLINLGFLFALFGRAVASPAQDAIDAYIKNDFPAELKLAQEGNSMAQDHLSAMYSKGRDVARNSNKALFWLRKAADNGLAQSQFQLGSLYERGGGVPQNYITALKWYRRAADQKFYVAYINLGDLYAEGHGVSQDYRRALYWYGMPAEEANAALARQKFGDLCLINDCDALANLRAYEFLEINASRTMFDDKKRATESAARLALKMTPEQVVEGGRLAVSWLNQNPAPRFPL